MKVYISRIHNSGQSNYVHLDCTYTKKNPKPTNDYDKFIVCGSTILLPKTEYEKMLKKWNSSNKGDILYWNCVEIGFEKGKGAFIKE